MNPGFGPSSVRKSPSQLFVEAIRIRLGCQISTLRKHNSCQALSPHLDCAQIRSRVENLFEPAPARSRFNFNVPAAFARPTLPAESVSSGFSPALGIGRKNAPFHAAAPPDSRVTGISCTGLRECILLLRSCRAGAQRRVPVERNAFSKIGVATFPQHYFCHNLPSMIKLSSWLDQARHKGRTVLCLSFSWFVQPSVRTGD
ncbi:hypothetical protein BJ322DRAFT_1046065 [Thelephora terrestris]|uniref:Uncharacterized protein n=1 Tax=Thelephora terrestris TaxID=56493 RepID=A0A9P6HIP3_9AGAM|nr:hypothetical protein BJ322DRAFT_1046065 [Thelephora terrestris]